MKKILINFVTLSRNGIDIPRLLKFRALNSMGCELELFSGKFIKKIEPAGKDVYTFNETIPDFRSYPRVKWTKTRFMLYALKMNLKGLFYIRKILQNRYDVIYSPAAVLDLVVIPYIVKMFDKKIIWVGVLDNAVPLNDPGNRFFRFLGWFFFRISLILLRKADRIFVVSEDLRNFMLESGFPGKKIVLSANGIENDLIEKAGADDRYNIDALFMGRINETKGIYDMLKVLGIVRKKYPGFQLAIMGGGDEITKRNFRKKIRAAGLERNIQFLGFRTGIEKFNIIKSSKCFWFLSYSESFGIALLEAVSSGVPAFTYELEPFRKIYQNGEVDISPKGDHGAVAKKVIELFEKGDFSNERGEKLLGQYSWERVAEIEYNAMKKL